MNSKQKGSAFERKICKQLSLWISGGKKDDLLWRSAMSGGAATVGKRGGIKKANMCGDISAIGKAGHKLTNAVVLECKHYKDLKWANFLYNNKGEIRQFWEILLKDCRDFKKKPFLILKQNARPVIVGLSETLSHPPFAVIHDIRLYYLDELLEAYTITEFIREYT